MDKEYHLAAADYSENINETTICGCNTSYINKCCYLEPFYLHPPTSHPCDGIYINPMSSFISKPSQKSKDESFYLHSPHELVQTKITRLFCDKKSQKNKIERRDDTLTVKVDVHIDENSNNDKSLSTGSLVENQSIKDITEHAYEEIYMGPDETLSLKSISSNNKKISDEPSTCHRSRKSRRFSSRSSNGSESTSSQISNELQYSSTSIQALARHSFDRCMGNENPKPPDLSDRNIETPVEFDKTSKSSGEVKPALPPPPPPLPLPPRDGSSAIPRIIEAEKKNFKIESQVVINKHENVSPSSDQQHNPHQQQQQQQQQTFQVNVDEGATIEANSKPSQVSHLINKHMVLPFIPPKFTNVADSNTLLKPSEYLRSICKATNKNILSKARSVDNLDFRGIIKDSEEVDEHEVQTMTSTGPPPPPLPPQYSSAQRQEITISKTQKQKNTPQPLATISIQDLTSVQLRRTNIKMHVAKAFSSPPPRSVSMTNVSEPFFVQKTDLIAELKMIKDIPGIKKLKVEMAEVEKYQVKNIKNELNKTFNVSNFVDQIPEKDSSGNIIPIWKRQMLARKAAGRAKKELEDQIARENEEKRQKAIPPWKRQLLAKKDSVNPIKQAPLIDVPSVKVENILTIQKKKHEQKSTTLEYKKNEDANKKHHSDGEDNDNDALIIPWRAQLRKTNSKLNIVN